MRTVQFGAQHTFTFRNYHHGCFGRDRDNFKQEIAGLADRTGSRYSQELGYRVEPDAACTGDYITTCKIDTGAPDIKIRHLGENKFKAVIGLNEADMAIIRYSQEQMPKNAQHSVSIPPEDIPQITRDNISSFPVAE